MFEIGSNLCEFEYSKYPMMGVKFCLQVDAGAPGPADVLAASPAAAKAAVFANKFEAVLDEGLPAAVTRYLESNGNPNNVDAADVQAFLQGTGLPDIPNISVRPLGLCMRSHGQCL